MGLFEGLDVASASDNPFAIDDGTYPAIITKATAKPTQNGDKVGLNLEYTINDPEGKFHERKATEWKQIPDPGATDSDAQRAASFLKMRLANFGIPESRMNDVEESDLLGLDVVISIKNKDEYVNVTKVALPKDDGAAPMFK